MKYILLIFLLVSCTVITGNNNSTETGCNISDVNGTKDEKLRNTSN